jgi:hypothetical protein
MDGKHNPSAYAKTGYQALKKKEEEMKRGSLMKKDTFKNI